MKILSLGNVHRVFISFRGDELRYSFVSHLLDAFERHGISFFVDKDEQRGKDLTNLLLRIEESKIALVIFSTRYGESSWCMDELVKMKKRVDKGKLQVIPIFYKVRTRDVRRQSGEFGDMFWALAKNSRGHQIMEWKEALECISNKMGLSLPDKSSEADFIKEIVKEVQKNVAEIGCQATEDHQCINLLKNKRRKMYQFFPESEKTSRGENVNEVERNVGEIGCQATEDDQCINFLHNKRRKMYQLFPDCEKTILENGDVNFSYARSQEEHNQEVLRLKCDCLQ